MRSELEGNIFTALSLSTGGEFLFHDVLGTKLMKIFAAEEDIALTLQIIR